MCLLLLLLPLFSLCIRMVVRSVGRSLVHVILLFLFRQHSHVEYALHCEKRCDVFSIGYNVPHWISLSAEAKLKSTVSTCVYVLHTVMHPSALHTLFVSGETFMCVWNRRSSRVYTHEQGESESTCSFTAANSFRYPSKFICWISKVYPPKLMASRRRRNLCWDRLRRSVR